MLLGARGMRREFCCWMTRGASCCCAASIREVFEETGLRLGDVTGPVAERDASFTFEGEDIRQLETYYTATTRHFEADRSGWTELEQRSVSATRWWSLDELTSTSDTVFPENLIDLVRALLER